MVELSRRTLLGGALAGVAGGLLAPGFVAADPNPSDDLAGVDWPSFLASSDLIRRRLPQTWFEGPFLGNGFLGSSIYAQPSANAIRFNVQHSEVQDHRPEFGRASCRERVSYHV